MQKQYDMNQNHLFTKEDFEPIPIDRDSITIVDQVQPTQSFFAENDRHEIEKLLHGLLKNTTEPSERQSASNDATSMDLSSIFTVPTTAQQHTMPQESEEFIDSDFWTDDSSTPESHDSDRKVAASATTPTSAAAGNDDAETTDKSARFRNHQSKNWMKQYQELADYKRKYGHCVVDAKKCPALACWVKRQRHQYKSKQKGGHSTLVDDRQYMLESIGFVWDTRDASWEKRFNELLEFKKQHGHANVPGIYPANRALGIWVKSQRKQYLDDLSGKLANSDQATIRETRYRRLENIGFKWILRMGRSQEGSDKDDANSKAG